MIPPFNAAGWLPPGLHRATLVEVQERLGLLSELRRVQMESVRWMVELAVRAGVERIVLNGSFVSNIIEPNDVDCVLLVGPGFPRDAAAEKELLVGLPFLDIALADQDEFGDLIGHTFATDRLGAAKGLIEVIA